MKISYVVIAYNTENYITECIQSILKQKHHEQIIVINDGSTDNTLEEIKKFKNPEIVVISHSENKGCCYSRMEGLKRCTGDYMTFIDSDDYYLKQLPKLTIFSPDIVDFGFYGSLNAMGKCDKILSSGDKYYSGEELWEAYRTRKINQILINKLISKRLYTLVRDNLRIEDLPNYCDNFSIMSTYAFYAKSYKKIDDVYYFYRQGTGMTTYLSRVEKIKQFCQQKIAVERLVCLGIPEETLMREVIKRVLELYEYMCIFLVAKKKEEEQAKEENRLPKKLDKIKIEYGDDIKAREIILDKLGDELVKYGYDIS